MRWDVSKAHRCFFARARANYNNYRDSFNSTYYLLALLSKLARCYKPRTEQLKKSNRMPQLIPFFYLNQLSFSFLTLLVLIYVFSKYILPLFTFQQVIRMYITKLSKKA